MPDTITLIHPDLGEATVDLAQYLADAEGGDWTKTSCDAAGWKPKDKLPKQPKA